MVIPENKPVVLLGFMGSGKSTLGKQVASHLGWNFIDLDHFIETEQSKTISEIFRLEGESTFRQMESAALEKVLSKSFHVIAIGGGAPCFSGNIELIKRKSLSVYLKVSELQLASRLTYSNTPRPLIKGKSEPEVQKIIHDLLIAREPFYNQADIIIESDFITADLIVSQL